MISEMGQSMAFEVGLKKRLIAILFTASIASHATGQEIFFELVDSGVLTHSVHGQGKRMKLVSHYVSSDVVLN